MRMTATALPTCVVIDMLGKAELRPNVSLKKRKKERENREEEGKNSTPPSSGCTTRNKFGLFFKRGNVNQKV